ncbi:hypothetical protein [Dysgonomonas macrotermitis]|uniref:Uncharacterized protein n=1 Tax=Dysgonomonas macrotermitis TaxID=1346286 RepID=A0A1M4YDN3_9BACT|nr:hypothetical protein [Dysgonomonas macrotermitis]SHF03944.1 hypothetical protein SAMN05444362_103144 [Dysgonomonas macrotermitis]
MKKKLIIIIFLIPTILYSQNFADNIEVDIAHLYDSDEIQESYKETLSNYNHRKSTEDTILIDKVIPIYKYRYDCELTRLNDLQQLEYMESNNLNSIPLPKKDFINYLFYSNLRRINPTYSSNKKNKIRFDFTFYFFDKQNKVIGYGGPSEFYILKHYENSQAFKSDQTFADDIKRLKITDLFIIIDIPNIPIFGKTFDNRIYVYDRKMEKFDTLEKFVEGHPEIFK